MAEAFFVGERLVETMNSCAFSEWRVRRSVERE